MLQNLRRLDVCSSLDQKERFVWMSLLMVFRAGVDFGCWKLRRTGGGGGVWKFSQLLKSENDLFSVCLDCSCPQTALALEQAAVFSGLNFEVENLESNQVL